MTNRVHAMILGMIYCLDKVKTLTLIIVFLETTNATVEPYQNQNNQCINQNNQRSISSNKQLQYQQHIACYTENERTEWILALQSASHRSMKNHLDSLRNRLRQKVSIQFNLNCMLDK